MQGVMLKFIQSATFQLGLVYILIVLCLSCVFFLCYGTFLLFKYCICSKQRNYNIFIQQIDLSIDKLALYNNNTVDDEEKIQ